jgi:hypothetical protein
MAFVSVVFVLDHPFGPFVHVVCRRTRIGSVVGITGQHAGDVLPDHPAGPIAVSDGKIREGEVATRISQSLAESGDREGLAGSSSDENIESCASAGFTGMAPKMIATAWVRARMRGGHWSNDTCSVALSLSL